MNLVKLRKIITRFPKLPIFPIFPISLISSILPLFSPSICFFSFFCYLCTAKMVVVQTIKRNIMSWVLLLLVFLNIGSSTLFIHEHNIEGRIVAHSHPFSGNPESHSHSLAQLDLISRLSRADMLLSESVVVAPCDYLREFTPNIYNYSYSCSLLSSVAQLRAPPVA